MRNQKPGSAINKFDPNCHEITVFCKRIDRALERIANNNTLLFVARREETTNVMIVRYALPLIRRVKHVDDKGHKFRVTGVGDGRYMPLEYGEVGSRGFSGVCWSLDVKFRQGCVSTVDYSDSYLYSYPRYEQYPLLDFAEDHNVLDQLVDNIILRNVGIFVKDLHPSVHTESFLRYDEGIDAIPPLFTNPKNSVARQSQILKDHFNIQVGVGQESAVNKQLQNK